MRTFAWFAFLTVPATSADVLVYGATPAGIAAAVAAASQGKTVDLIEPSSHLGGLITSGLCHTDFHTREALTGAYFDLTWRIVAHYAKAYGPDSPQVKATYFGNFAEPKVNEAVFEAMIKEQPKITVWRSWTLLSVQTSATRIENATFGKDASTKVFKAAVYIDATYEGDLLAAAGVPFAIGREAKTAYGEALAPDAADEQLQAYNFRICITKVPENRVALTKPDWYRREDYAGVLPLLASKKLTKAFGAQGEPSVFKAHDPPLPNGKYDVNDVSRGLVRLSLPGENLGWAKGTPKEREAIAETHRRWQYGMMYFLQYDDAVPETVRTAAQEWGLCKDEFTDTNHWPPLLYIRESRRMVGLKVFTQADTRHAKDDARAVFHADSIAIGDYGPNCHGTGHEGGRIGGKHTGEFYENVPPYQIPYGVIVPKTMTNLLVPVACSSSHVGYCALRLEPIWMNLGEAAGLAASLVGSGTVQSVDVIALQKLLHARGAATIYLSDVPPTHPQFAAAQAWGQRGGWHGVEPMPAKPGERGKRLFSQYFEAFPGHAAKLDAALDGDLRKRWSEMSKLTLSENVRTRGDFLKLRP